MRARSNLMKSTITARTLDYFGLLVAASVIALFSGVVATLCVKFVGVARGDWPQWRAA